MDLFDDFIDFGYNFVDTGADLADLYLTGDQIVQQVEGGSSSGSINYPSYYVPSQPVTTTPQIDLNSLNLGVPSTSSENNTKYYIIGGSILASLIVLGLILKK